MKTKQRLILLGLVIAAVFVFTACNNSQETDSPELVYTEAALTVAAQLTNLAENNKTAEATATWTPEPEEAEATSTPQDQSPTATEQSGGEDTLPTATKSSNSGTCSLVADYVSDVTYPDDATVSPGETFTKTWQIMNSGSCVWGDGYTVFFQSGDNMGASEGTSLTHGIDVAGGTLINVSVELTAPSEAGTYRANFQFKDANGKVFGTGTNASGVVYVQIVVAEPTATPTKTKPPTETSIPTATETPVPTTAP